VNSCSLLAPLRTWSPSHLLAPTHPRNCAADEYPHQKQQRWGVCGWRGGSALCGSLGTLYVMFGACRMDMRSGCCSVCVCVCVC
jgi:hypothetical protein